jgi:hypothetical protein
MKGARSQGARRKATELRRIERSLSPPRRPRPRLVESGATASNEKKRQPRERWSLPAALGESSSSALSRRSSSAPSNPRQKARPVISTSQVEASEAPTERGRPSSPAQLKHGERSLSPQRSPVRSPALADSDRPAGRHSLPRAADFQKTSRRSLPSRIEPEHSSATAQASQPVDVLETLLERYDDYHGLYGSVEGDPTAPITKGQLDIDHDALDAMKRAKVSKEKGEVAKQRGAGETSP